MTKFLDGTGLSYLMEKITSMLSTKTDKMVVDTTTFGSTSTVTGSKLQHNRYYKFGTLAVLVIGSITTPEDETEYYETVLEFTAGSSTMSLSLPSGWSWVGGSAPTLSVSRRYRIRMSMGWAEIVCLDA